MATTRKAAVDPLIAELPEAKPKDSLEVKFEIQISPYVVQGRTRWRWEILDHNFKGYSGDYSGHRDANFDTAVDAEADAEVYIERIRAAVQLKLDVPDAYTITL